MATMMTGGDPPLKPPRGVKQAKETSGLLMSVIRTLSASESNEQRDREKAKLEKEYKKSDQKLDVLVSHNRDDLTLVMQVFGQLSARITDSREKIHAVKENLHACKTLLRCRRDEIKKLWLEGIEHKHILQLLEEIDQLREVPAQFAAFLSKKHYLHATQLLVSALSLGEGNLEGVEALREVRADLLLKKEKLHLKLMEELGYHLYVHSTQDVFSLRRQGSGRDNMLLLNSPFQRAGELRSSTKVVKARRNLLEVNSIPRPSSSPNITLMQKEDDVDNVQEDIEAEDPEANSQHFMMILVESLALLNKLPDAVEAIKSKMQGELLSIIERTTQQLLDCPIPSQTQTYGRSALVELFETVFEQFKCVARCHTSILYSFSRVSEKYRVDICLYEMPDVWSKIQAVLQLLLTDYLDIQNTTSDAQQAPTSFTEPTSDISAYFSRRKQPRQKKIPLFKFDYSSHALSMNNYLKEQWNNNAGTKEYESAPRPQRNKLLVCRPDPTNITDIFIPLMRFIEDIEREIRCSSSSPCTLYVFLADYVKEVFLGNHHLKVVKTIDSATKSPDAWRTTTNPDTIKKLSLSRPLLQSTVIVEQCIQDSRKLMQALPLYAEHFLSLICNILHNYRETCQAAYRGIVQPDSEDKRICSAAWLKDEDISRFIKSLPNWADLQAHKKMQQQRHAQRRDEVPEEESPDEVWQRNMREAEILASNLGEGGINEHEILSDISQLRGLALLQESMEWFSASILSFTLELPHVGSTSPKLDTTHAIPVMPESSIRSLTQLAKEFEELANTCLLVLHLEVRVQCFHYLLPRGNNYSRFAGGGIDSQEPDPKVLKLSQVLISVDEAMSSSLQLRKMKYIFEGLGHLIAKILISSAQFIERIDEGGIRKMCRNIFTLQQTLTNITMAREIALDHARHYFELFYLTPEEILSGVMEKGPRFSELEYMNAFQLINRSQQEPDYGAINIHLGRLADILGEVGITV